MYTGCFKPPVWYVYCIVYNKQNKHPVPTVTPHFWRQINQENHYFLLYELLQMWGGGNLIASHVKVCTACDIYYFNGLCTFIILFIIKFETPSTYLFYCARYLRWNTLWQNLYYYPYLITLRTVRTTLKTQLRSPLNR